MQRIDAKGRGARARGALGEKAKAGEIAYALIAITARAFAPEAIDLRANAEHAALGEALRQEGGFGRDGEMTGAVGRGVRHDFVTPERQFGQGNVAQQRSAPVRGEHFATAPERRRNLDDMGRAVLAGDGQREGQRAV